MNNIQIRVICCCTLLACSELFHSEVLSVYLLLYRSHWIQIIQPELPLPLRKPGLHCKLSIWGISWVSHVGAALKKRHQTKGLPFSTFHGSASLMQSFSCWSIATQKLMESLLTGWWVISWSDRVSLYAVCLIRYFSIAFFLIFSRFVFLMLMFHLQRKQIWYCKPIATLTKLRNLFLKVCIFYKALSVHLFT